MTAAAGGPRHAEHGFSLHVVSTGARLRELGRTMHNCLATYGDRLDGAHRIVEVRQGRKVRYAVHIEQGRIVTFEAPGNRPPEPADVPVVRELLERGGYLTATLVADRPAGRTPPAPDGQLTLVPAAPVAPAGRAGGPVGAPAGPAGAPVGVPPVGPGRPGAGPDAAPPVGLGRPRARPDAAPSVGASRPRARPAGDPGVEHGRPGGPATSVRRTVPSEPAVHPVGVSLQRLATELLGPPSLQAPDWSEVAAALWAAGLLPRLPSPTQTTFERIVRDLAAKVAVGQDAGLPRVTPPTAEQRAGARRRLLADDGPGEGWQRRRMAAVLEYPLRP